MIKLNEMIKQEAALQQALIESEIIFAVTPTKPEPELPPLPLEELPPDPG